MSKSGNKSPRIGHLNYRISPYHCLLLLLIVVVGFICYCYMPDRDDVAAEMLTAWGGDLQRESRIGVQDFCERGAIWRVDFRKNEQVTEEMLACLVPLRALKVLNLWGRKIDKDALPHLSKLHYLEDLGLGQSDITDDDIRHLRTLKDLRRLSLADTAITDECLMHLTELKGLVTLNIEGTRITADGVARLVGHLPRTAIIRFE